MLGAQHGSSVLQAALVRYTFAVEFVEPTPANGSDDRYRANCEIAGKDRFRAVQRSRERPLLGRATGCNGSTAAERANNLTDSVRPRSGHPSPTESPSSARSSRSLGIVVPRARAAPYWNKGVFVLLTEPRLGWVGSVFAYALRTDTIINVARIPSVAGTDEPELLVRDLG